MLVLLIGIVMHMTIRADAADLSSKSHRRGAHNISGSFSNIKHQNEINTPSGTLQITLSETTTPITPHEAATPLGEVSQQAPLNDNVNVLLAGKQVGAFTSDQAAIVAVYPNASLAKLVLIELDSGGAGCPIMYRLAEIKIDKTLALTDEFGDCLLIDRIDKVNGIWTFHFYSPGNLPSEVWIYQKGKITKA